MAAIKARKCFFPRSPSDWVHRIFLTCDNILAVQFNHGEKVHKVSDHGPGAYLGWGGVPGVCCLYPTTQGELAEQLYDLATVWSFAGEFVHRFLYKKLPYRIVSPPGTCGNCITSCGVSTSVAGNTVTITVTVTNTDGSATLGEAPEGDVQILVDGVQVADLTLPEDEPDTTRSRAVSTSYICTDSNAHTVAANYSPAAGSGMIACSCGASFQCPACQTVGCCPNCINNTLRATSQDTGEQATLTYNASTSRWEGSTTMNCGHTLYFRVQCPAGSTQVTQWAFQGSWDGTTWFAPCAADPSSTCSPLSLLWFACRIGGVTPAGCLQFQNWTVTP
jgi:hypothetical protein